MKKVKSEFEDKIKAHIEHIRAARNEKIKQAENEKAESLQKLLHKERELNAYKAQKAQLEKDRQNQLHKNQKAELKADRKTLMTEITEMLKISKSHIRVLSERSPYSKKTLEIIETLKDNRLKAKAIKHWLKETHLSEALKANIKSLQVLFTTISKGEDTSKAGRKAMDIKTYKADCYLPDELHGRNRTTLFAGESKNISALLNGFNQLNNKIKQDIKSYNDRYFDALRSKEVRSGKLVTDVDKEITEMRKDKKFR